MSARVFTTAALLAPLALLAPSARTQEPAADWREIVKPPLRPFTPQQPRRVVLPNGLVMFLQEDRELPLVQGSLRVRGGSREEGAAKTGLVTIYGQAWRTGGTRSRSGDELDDFLEARAARVETGGGVDSTTLVWNCLRDNHDEVLAVVVELLRQPEFRPDKIELAKHQLRTGIARRNDNPQAILFRESAKIVYGPDSPYARQVEYATVAAVERDDLLSWHRRHAHPNNAILGITGDFDARAMEAKLRKAFSAWPKGEAAGEVEATFRDPKPGVYFVQKDDVTQSQIRLVHLGTTRDNPDYYALTVMNEVLGGSFASRLFSNVRSKKGLAYAVSGSVGMNYDHPGVFQLFLGTKSETTAAGIQALFDEIENLKATPATSDELARAKDSILNSFIFQVDSKWKVLGQKTTYEFYGYPLDFLERFRTGIEKVTAADVERVAKRYVHKDRLAIVVVGKADAFDRPLSEFGPVTTLDISIPPPPAAAGAP